MTNKTLDTRQKLTFRIAPSGQKLRQSVALATEPQRHTHADQRRFHQRNSLKKLADTGRD